MVKKKTIFIIILYFITISYISAQANLYVNVNDSVYDILKIAEMRKWVTSLPQARPYTRKVVLKLLEEIQSHTNISFYEKNIIEQEIKRIKGKVNQAKPNDFLQTGKVPFVVNEKFPLQLTTSLNINSQIGLSDNILFNIDAGLGVGIEGNIYKNFSYMLSFSALVIKWEPDNFLPYSFTKRWDGNIRTVNGDTSDSDGGTSFNFGNGISFGFSTNVQMNYSVFDDKLQISGSFVRRDFGNGIGNLSYSATARPLPAVQINFHPAKWFSYNYLIGSLYGFDQKISSNNAMLSFQQLEFFPAHWLYIGLTMSNIWVKRFELTYLLPIYPILNSQELVGDYDNSTMQGSIAFTFPYVKIYGNLFIDEMRPQLISELFTLPRQQFAFQAGINGVIPYIPLTTLSFQYTKIEPYTYTHYAQRNPNDPKGFPGYINISWMNDGENLGYNIQPNSDQFLIKATSHPLPGLTIVLGYQLVRHGDGDRTKGEMEGRIDSVFFEHQKPVRPH